LGGPTGSAQPLLWAHAEYVKLHRSTADRKVFDLVEAVYDRYVRGNGQRVPIEVWKFNRQVQMVESGSILRVQATSPFLLHWTSDAWQHSTDANSKATAIGIEFADIPVARVQSAPIRFTLFWTEENRWEGKDYAVKVRASKVEVQVPANAKEYNETGSQAC
jgi:glucoamylase